MTRLTASTLVAGLALILTGCGHATPGRDGPGDGSATAVSVGREFWYAGWHGRVVRADLDLDGGSAAVVLELTNQGKQVRRWKAAVTLVAASQSYPGEVTAADVAAGGQRDLVATFAVDATARLAGARLQVGDPDHRQAVVPLDSDEGYEPLAPRPVSVTGVVNRGRVPTLQVTSAELRADNPQGYEEARSGHTFLRLGFDAVNESPGIFALVYVFDHGLRLPNGTLLGTTTGCGDPQAHPRPYATDPGHVVCFEIPEPPGGEYVWSLGDAEQAGLRFAL